MKIAPVAVAALGALAWLNRPPAVDKVIEDIAVSAGKLVRGIRNNNPGNIERTSTRWQGMAADQSADPRFIVFDSPEYGIRAMARILDTYYHNYGLTTVRAIVNRWAPPAENNTAAYVQDVAATMGVDPDAPLAWPAEQPALVAAIIKHENGFQPYAAETIDKGVALA